MLKTRLWMGAILIVLTLGMIVGDRFLAPWFPFLFVFLLGLSLAACHELIVLLGSQRAPHKAICYVGVVVFAFANWGINYPATHAHTWIYLLAILAGFLLVVFLYEMAVFEAPGRSIERMAVTWWLLGYLGFLPCFFAQVRWLSDDQLANSVRLALAVFVPKGCDIGAYAVGRLIGRHKMTPVLSPGKTWEGAVGGLAFATLLAVGIDQLAPNPPLRQDVLWECLFGFSVGLAGMLGDLAESLIKRDCQSKDASTAVPGFGGVLDVVDAILFSAPVCYLWFYLLK